MKKMIGTSLVLAALLALGISAFATTYDNAVGGTVMPANRCRTFVIGNTVTNASLASNDVVKLININSNQVVRGITYQIVTAATSNDIACTVAFGDNTTSTGFVTSVDGYAAGAQTWAVWHDGTPEYYSATNSINMTVLYGVSETGLVVDVKALVDDFNDE